MSHFAIGCRRCGKALEEVYCAFCEHCEDSLLVTQYKDRRFSGGEIGRASCRERV